MICMECGAPIKLRESIQAAKFSWPLDQMVWYECNACGKGNHVRFDKGAAHNVTYLGGPGYDYVVNSTTKESSLEIRVDPGYLHIWLNGEHFEVREHE